MKRDYLLLGISVVVGAAALSVTAPRVLAMGRTGCSRRRTRLGESVSPSQWRRAAAGNPEQ